MREVNKCLLGFCERTKTKKCNAAGLARPIGRQREPGTKGPKKTGKGSPTARQASKGTGKRKALLTYTVFEKRQQALRRSRNATIDEEAANATAEKKRRTLVVLARA